MSQFLRAESHCVDAGDDKVFRRRRISPVDGLKSGQFNQEREDRNRWVWVPAKSVYTVYQNSVESRPTLVLYIAGL